MTLAEFLSTTGTTDEAFAASIGVSRSMVTKLRNRTTKPSADTALRIIEIAGPRVSLAELMPEKSAQGPRRDPSQPSAPPTAPEPADHSHSIGLDREQA